MKSWILLIAAFLFSHYSIAQTCTALGQNPHSAFPVCGTSVFTQNTVPLCGGREVPTPCDDDVYTDVNPFWYKFTCFSSGTLGFLISPLIHDEDYDWQLFDITGRNPGEVYTNPALFVACNWSAEFGPTGTAASSSSLIQCAGPGIPLFTAMPTLIQGHEYLLLVSHFTNTQSGYNLSFNGGTAVITDPQTPHVDTASAFCDGTSITIKLNKKMNCRTLAANGSDFSINTAVAAITGAVGQGCANSFDMDAVTLTLDNPLPPGDYTISVKLGTDGNTIQDICERSIPVDESVSITILPLQPTPMDSLTTPGCAPEYLDLVFAKPIRCSSIAPDGSDFIVSGSYPAQVSGASFSCNNGLTQSIRVQLSAPMQRAGNFNIRLVSSLDGNTIIDECGMETPAGATLPFSLMDTVSAAFQLSVTPGCVLDTVNFSHNGANNTNTWNWAFDRDRLYTIQNPEIYYSTPGEKFTTLIVSNGFCADTVTQSFILEENITAAFESTMLICPGEQARFSDMSAGNPVAWLWDFNNGNSSNLQSPPLQSYNASGPTHQVQVKLTVTDGAGCSDTTSRLVTVINNCFIAVPSAFTPNGDGLNDFLYPINAYKATNLTFTVFNRFGQRIFQTREWTNKWDGMFKGQGADPGTYVWTLTYTDPDTNAPVNQKGTVVLIR